MNRSWVFDSSPLITLGKAGCLDLLAGLQGPVYIPRSVKKEILAKKPPDLSSAWLLDKNCPARMVSASLTAAVLSRDLGAGETETISYALRHRDCVAVLDDRKARHCARAMGVQVKGTVGLLLWLKKRGKLDKIKPILASLIRSGFRIDPIVLKLALKLAGEQGSRLGGEYPPTAQEIPALYKTGRSKVKARKRLKPR